MAELSFNEQERIARQLEAIEGRFEELSIRITLPEVIADSALFTSLMREHAEMEELNAIAVAYRRLREEIAAAQELLEDPDMREMAREELLSSMSAWRPIPRLRASPCCPRTRTTTRTPFLKYAPARAAMRQVSSARSFCACTLTTQPLRAGNLSSSRTVPRNLAA